MRKVAVFSVAGVLLTLLCWVLVYLLNISSAYVVYFYQAAIERKGFWVCFVYFWQIAFSFHASVKISGELVGKIELWKFLWMFSDEDVMRVFMKLIGTLRIVSTEIQLLFAIPLKSFLNTGIQSRFLKLQK